MYKAPSTDFCSGAATPGVALTPIDDTIESRLWLQEYSWLHGLLRSGANVCPSFRFPDLISAAITLSLTQPDGTAQIFRFLGTQLVLRSLTAARRRESIWRPQFEQLRELQRSPANRHPNPNFQLDQLATACVAYARLLDESGARLLHQARLNMAERTRNAILEAKRISPLHPGVFGVAGEEGNLAP